MSLLTLAVFCTCLTAIDAAASLFNGSEPTAYILDFNTSDNPLNIKVVTPYNLNYFMMIGDWGAANGEATYLSVQKAVAKKMLDYYTSQKAKGYNLLFIAALGDNFYWTGQDTQEWIPHWQDIYGELATDIPWLAVMGNHDWGNADPTALCAWNYARYVSPAGIPYASNQLNKDKGGTNPSNYYMPDFGYYYTINELNFELIAVDENASDCPGGLGGDGPNNGAKELFADCGGSTSVGCGYLNKIREASENMLIQRAKTSQNTNFVITQHYPGVGQDLLETWWSHRVSNSSQNYTVNCTVQQNIDYYQPGNPSEPCDTVEQCCSMCFQRFDCNYWTLYDGLCYFKQTNQGEQQSSGRISGQCLGKNSSHTSGEMVVSAYGHAHAQTCDGSVETQYGYLCNVILSGGGGGCCSEGTPRGFFVLGFDQDKHMVQPMKIDDPTLVCNYPCGAVIDEKEAEKIKIDTCCHTKDDTSIDCSDVDAKQCYNAL